jgi:hypothetical protein
MLFDRLVPFVKQPPTDLSWGCNGRVLLAASQDGTVAVLHFTDDQFAAAIPLAEVSCSIACSTKSCIACAHTLSEQCLFASHTVVCYLVQ